MSDPTISMRVSVTPAGPQGMVTLRGDLTNLASAIGAVTGHDMPDTRRVSGGLGGGVAWMSPDELLLFCPHARADHVVDELSAELADMHHLAVNVSDARTVFTIEGPDARDLLAKLSPVDLAPSAFAPGELRRTRLSQVAAAFWMAGPETFHLIAFRSVDMYVADLLQTAAEGAVLGLHTPGR
ncbi:MAG: sarcosine oxidase subunit gamma family protein [Pseudomonadota bacterium]